MNRQITAAATKLIAIGRKIDRLRGTLVADPVDQDRHEQAEPDDEGRQEDHPEKVVPQRDERVRLAEEPAVVVEPDERVTAPVLEAPDDVAIVG